MTVAAVPTTAELSRQPVPRTPRGTVLATGDSRQPATLPSDLLALISEGRPAWHADAACREFPDVDFFPAIGESSAPAKAVCAGCLVREECLAEALSRPPAQVHGVWAGTTGRQRRVLAAERDGLVVATETCLDCGKTSRGGSRCVRCEERRDRLEVEAFAVAVLG